MKRTAFVDIGSLASKVALFSIGLQNREERGNRRVRYPGDKRFIPVRDFVPDQ